ncbi:DNA internalization-related competence protein ComEC/Rec2 [Lentzea sp. CC55]|uniref:DNA internalization-related competence protein ComEC/Rec2 n=1 Tax=Lentzea sp. CC55 TaxID=2884909 RepID=UPI0027E1BEC8|nr:DNA internalization-related competence protein ComEC/Rec2 [Lentzea sp. CC55]MCG8926285.1 DNA internalization-related competence protein ComEC/Rec2 [Lentzea sp. CC55]
MARKHPVAQDYRLVPAAAAVWTTAVAGLFLSWQAAVGTGVAAGAIGLAAWRRAWWNRTCAIALLISGPVAAAWVGGHVLRAESHPLRLAANEGRSTTLTVEIVTRPKGIRAEGFASHQAGVDNVVVKATAGGAQLVLLAPAAKWRDLVPGQKVTVKGTLAPPRGGDLASALLRVRGPPADPQPPPVWQSWADDLRDGLAQASRVLDDEEAGLLPALVVGDTEQMVPRIVDEFRTAGLAHLLAVSGANLAIVCGAVYLLTRRLGPRKAAVAAMVALVGFVVLAGPEPSVLRAAVMGAVTLLGLVLGRERSAVPSLAAAVLVLVLHDPALGGEPGFALSVVATAALVLIAPRWAQALKQRGVPNGLAEAVVVPTAASLATAPLVAGLSGQVSLVSVLANLVAGPVVAPATVLGVVAAVVAPFSPRAAELVAHVAGPAVTWLIQVGRQASTVPGAAVGWPDGWTGALALAAVTAVVVLLLRLKKTRTLVVAVLVGGFVVLVPMRVVAPVWPPDGWKVVSCDVGQGDALVLATDVADTAVLVDAGPDPGAVDRCLKTLGITKIPLVVLTHLHADHVGGLEAALTGRAVGAIAVGPLKEPEWAWREVGRQARAQNVRVVEPKAGERFALPGLDLEVMGPRRPPVAEAENTTVNDYSLVLKAHTRAGRVLLTGDVELAGQAALLGERDLTAEVLKVPHHGSRYSLPAFLRAVRPQIALVSVGTGNRYGHPSPQVIDVLRTGGASVLRTDKDGDLAVLPGNRIVRRRRDGLDQAVQRALPDSRRHAGPRMGAVADELRGDPVAARRTQTRFRLLHLRNTRRRHPRRHVQGDHHPRAAAHQGGETGRGVRPHGRARVRRRPAHRPGRLARLPLQRPEGGSPVAATDRGLARDRGGGGTTRGGRPAALPAHGLAEDGRDRLVNQRALSRSCCAATETHPDRTARFRSSPSLERKVHLRLRRRSRVPGAGKEVTTPAP